MNDPFARLSQAMARTRWAVALVWLVILIVAAVIIGPRATSVVKPGGFDAPNSESAQVGNILQAKFQGSSRNNLIVVFRSQASTAGNARYRKQVMGAAARLARVDGVRAVRTYYSTGDPSLESRDGHVTVAIVTLVGDQTRVQGAIPALREQLSTVKIEHFITGSGAVEYDSNVSSEEDLRRAEVITVPVVLILLLLVFRTAVAAAIPVVLGACSVSLATALTAIIGSWIDMSIFALNVASMIGLGLGIDFALILISRYRQELAARATGQPGPDHVGEALAATMATSGRSILYSGLTIILAMSAMTGLMWDLMFMRSISIAVILVVATGLLAALTLLPALLAILGHRIFWLPVFPPSRRSTRRESAGVWFRLSHAIMNHPWIWLLASVAVLAFAAFPVRGVNFGRGTSDSPHNTEAYKGFAVMSKSFGASDLVPIQIVIQTGKERVFTPHFLRLLTRLTDDVAADPRVKQVGSLVTLARSAGISRGSIPSLRPRTFSSNRKLAPLAEEFVNLHGRKDVAVISLVSKYGEFDAQHQDTVQDLRTKLVSRIPGLAAYHILVGGEAAYFLDFRDAIYGRFPLLLTIVTLIIFLVLMMFFQSVFLPIKALAMNFASILATFGVLVAVFQHGLGSNILGFTPPILINVVLPPVLFVILLGLSTDYEVFMLSRVKEFYHETRNNRLAVAEGLQNTAGVITAAGLILIGTFGSFATANGVIVKSLGVGMAMGVLLDTTIVRVVMVPATMRLMGDLNWWMPAWLSRIIPELREGPALPQPALAPLAGPPPAHSPIPSSMALVASQPAAASRSVKVPVLPPQVPTPAVAAPAATFDPSATLLFAQLKPEAAEAPSIERTMRLRPLNTASGLVVSTLSGSGSLTIGRDPANDLQIAHPEVSRFHARIDFGDRGDFIHDLRSSNHVFVNGKVIQSDTPVPLRPGDIIQFAAQPELTFSFESA